MNELEIEQFRQKLFVLRSELQTLEESSKPMDLEQAALDGLSRADAMQAHLVAQEPARRRQRQLGKIAGAFRRIEAGDYGTCYLCGEEIDIHLLAAKPTCTRCEKCVKS